MKIPRVLAVGACIAFWCGGVAVPLGAVLARVHGLDGFWDPDVRSVAWVTASQALVSTVLSAAIGLPLGLAAARAGGRLARVLDLLLLLPQGVPTVVAATAWIAWLGRAGLLGCLELAYSLPAVVLAHVFFNAPWVALAVAQAARAVPAAPRAAASTLGAGPWARFRYVAWPSVRWALGASAAQTLAACSMSFALVLLLGGGPPVETLETALFSRLRGGALDLSGAAACGVWELALTLPPWIALLALRARVPRTEIASVSSIRSARGGGLGWLALGGAVFLLVPYCAVFAGASAWLRPELWREALAPLGWSLAVAASAAVGTLAVAALATLALASLSGPVQAFAGALLAVPSGVSVMVLGLGAWLAYGRWIDPFEGSFGAIVAVQVVVFFPAAQRILWPVAQAGQPGALDAAWTLGASPWRAFWLVDWPRWRAPVASALGLAAGAAIGEVAAVSLFASDRWAPLPLLVPRWMAQYRFEDARAVSALLWVVAGLLMAGAALVGRGERRAHV